jgi:hypothetical protein
VEDRALAKQASFESDPSAHTGDGATGQSHCGPARRVPSCTVQKSETLLVQKVVLRGARLDAAPPFTFTAWLDARLTKSAVKASWKRQPTNTF